jgi:hypothetical protein
LSRTAAICAAGVIGVAGLTQAVADDWASITPPAGLAAECWNHLVNHFREKPYTVAEIQPSLDLLAAALKEGMPADAVVTRLEEGVVKRADAATVRATVQRRMDALRTAKPLVTEAGYPLWSTPPMQGLLMAVASAIESDVPMAGLRQALKLGGGTRAMRVKFVVEAGESLKLMGLDAETISRLMEDFATRNLGCGEIVRATQFIGQQHRAGVAGPRISEMLWSNRGAGPPPR